jgi:hypothetical protein
LSAAANIEKLLKIDVVFVVEKRLSKFGQNWPDNNHRYTKTPRPKAKLLGNILAGRSSAQIVQEAFVS